MSPIESFDLSANSGIESMRRLFARSTDGMALLDDAGRIVVWNEALERLLCMDGASLRGCPAVGLGKSDVADPQDWLEAASTDECTLSLSGGGRRTAASASVSKVDDMAGHRLLRLRDASRERRAEIRLQRFLRTIDASDSALAILRPDGTIVGVSGGFTRLFGHRLADIVGRDLHEVLAADGSEDDATPLRYPPRPPAVDRGPGVPQFTALVQTRDGQRLWISAVISPVLGDDGSVIRLAAVLTDVTSTKVREVLQYKALEAMARDRPLHELASLVCSELERVAPEVRVAIYDFDEEGRPMVLAAPGLPAAYAKTVAAFVPTLRGRRRRALALNTPTVLADLAGDPRCAAFAAAALAMEVKAFWSRPIVASDGRTAGALAFHYREPRVPAEFHRRLAEISVHPLVLAFERERTRARLHRLSNYDTLTGLPNRVMLRTQAARMLVDAERTGSPLAVLVFDVDRFKRINDTQGPGAGDELLCEIARRLAAGVRGGDFLARPAADEFVAVLPQCAAKQAAAMAERMLDLVRRPAVAGTMTFNPAATVGIAVFPDDGRDADALIGCADFAMHQAKGMARGGVRFFRAEMNASMRERVTMELALREALAKNELRLHYQPQVIDGEARALHGVEALLRWRHAELGEVLPALFVPLAEECGLIDELSAWVLDEACRQMAQWRRRSVAVPRVAVNVSASSFADPHLARRVDAVLRRHDLAPSDLTLEITEQVMIDGSEGTSASIGAVRALGVQLSLDDFGTGYSSLGHLHRLPFDEIKLDRSFVRDLAASASARALTTTVLRIGESLGMTVIAEGVETPEQLAFLADRGCPVVQGYLFGRPMCAADLERWMDRRVGPPPPLKAAS